MESIQSNNGGNVNQLTPDLLDLAKHFAGSGVKIPFEIVEENGESVQQMSHHFQEVSHSLHNEQGIEISPEAIASHFPPSLAETLLTSIINQSTSSASTTLLDSGTQGLQIGGITYSDLADVTRVMNATLDPSLTASSSATIPPSSSSDVMSGVFTESDVIHSSPESNFDTNDLLNSVLQNEEGMAKLSSASARPVGVAAATTILSGRKRKRDESDSNPALQKYDCSKLLRRLKETLDELSTRMGLQACVVTYQPSSKPEKSAASYKVFGTSLLRSCLEKQRGHVLGLMDSHLKNPTPVQEMKQAQLRKFIPNMLKCSTGREKPGWGKEEMKPVWWPQEVPWQNIRSDTRDKNQKKNISWSDCLRKIVLSCYLHHNRADQLPSSSNIEIDNSLELVQSNDPTQQLQLLQQHHGIHVDLSTLQSVAVASETTNGDIASLTADITGTQVDHSLLPNQQQVFTIDTGMGNCDTSGMPTLADASLAETAARLQQVADDTGQTQYATQTVTVTENDAKALGQPVGSTTTVRLTAYPSQGGTESTDPAAVESQQQSSPVPLAPPTSTAPGAQVVYSASHISDLLDSLVSSMATDNPGEIDSNEYLTKPTSATSIISSVDGSSNLASSISDGISLESLTSSTTGAH